MGKINVKGQNGTGLPRPSPLPAGTWLDTVKGGGLVVRCICANGTARKAHDFEGSDPSIHKVYCHYHAPRMHAKSHLLVKE